MNEQELSTQQLMELLHTFIYEMESTLTDENKKNRKYAPQVFWKNKHTLELLEERLGKLAAQENVIKMLQDVIEFSTKVPEIKPTKEGGFEILSAVGMRMTRDIENRERELLRAWVLETCFLKELKAINITKKKQVNIATLKILGLERYNEFCEVVGNKCKPLNKEEYDLLKEAFL